MADEIVLYDRTEGVVTLTFNHPQNLNAFTPEMRDALIAATGEAGADAQVRCVVLQGSGKGFMAGGDIKAYLALLDTLDADELQAHFQARVAALAPLVINLRRMRKPVLASVHGPVAGAGFSLMLACDLAVAADDAFFLLAYAGIGTSPDGGGSYHLPRQVGLKKAMEMAFLGERCSAAEAQALGLVNWVVGASERAGKTQEIAARLAAGPTQAFANTKELFNNALSANLIEQLDAEAGSFARSAATADFAEGVRAFNAKRKAKFRGL